MEFKFANQMRSMKPAASASHCLRVGRALAAVLDEFGAQLTRTVAFCKLGKGGRVEFSLLVAGDAMLVDAMNDRLEEMACDQPDLYDAMDELSEPSNDDGLQCYFSPEGNWPERLYANPDRIQALRGHGPVDFDALYARQQDLLARLLRAHGLQPD